MSTIKEISREQESRIEKLSMTYDVVKCSPVAEDETVRVECWNELDSTPEVGYSKRAPRIVEYTIDDDGNDVRR
jgi:hypothetical protein